MCAVLTTFGRIHRVPVIARHAENPPTLTHVVADIGSNTNDSDFQLPYRSVIENDGANIAPIIAMKKAPFGWPNEDSLK